MQCFTYMVAFNAQAMFLTCLTYTFALRHSEEEPGMLFVSEVRNPIRSSRVFSKGQFMACIALSIPLASSSCASPDVCQVTVITAC